MGALYSGTAITGYNANPPPDDGTTGANNQVTWNGTIKAKIGDPLNTAVAAMSTALIASLNKTISGGSVVSTAVDYPASAADQGRNIVFTASGHTLTTPDATSVLSPFVFCVNNQSSGNITLAGFSAQNIDGANTAKLGKGRGIILWTDGVNWFSSGLVMGNIPLTFPPFGFDAPINCQINSSAGSSLLTVSIVANDGTAPTTSNPVLIPFRDPAISGGGPFWVAVTAANSISTNAIGATLGTQNGNVPFRFWVLAFYNAGAVVLALWHSGAGSATPVINPLNEGTLQSTTAISAAATSAGVFYTPNGTTLTSKPFRILGYIEYNAGLTTAGTYPTAAPIMQLFGPGIKKPGDVLQTIYATTATISTTTAATFQTTNLTASITPTSAANAINYLASFNLHTSSATVPAISQMFRGGSGVGQITISGISTVYPAFLIGLDYPGVTTSTTYTVKFRNTDASSAVDFNYTTGNWSTSTSTMMLQEIMG